MSWQRTSISCDVGHTSTKKFGVWKSFSKKFFAEKNSKCVKKVLSSAELINATRVVQDDDFAYIKTAVRNFLRHNQRS